MSDVMDKRIEQKIMEVMRTNNQELLGSISGMISKISDKPSSLLDIPKLKRKSNEEQYKINSRVLEKIETAGSHVQAQNLTAAHEAIVQATELLKHRQKLVFLADTSELGWRVVSEYEANPIADDSDDEKRIYKAEARASRKAKSDKKRPRKNWPYRRPEQQPGLQQALHIAQTSRQRPGLCFMFGKSGHWKMECPQNTSQQNNKISSFMNCLVTDVKDSGTNHPEPTQAEVERQVSPSIGINPLKEDRVDSSINDVTPVGSLKKHLSKWSETSDNQYILDVVANGYKLPFKVIPERIEMRNNSLQGLIPVL
ncbi:uncharacterized protein LOC128237738 [Mya arenaria]|uniref:uncharacterized protein LOC128237738 n=1 Tax=Mya arenaria TaxID=6604 RepID=UPI0022E2B23B|nr:uncharacterized protein LOC128237738 [Mya arenaria]